MELVHCSFTTWRDSVISITIVTTMAFSWASTWKKLNKQQRNHISNNFPKSMCLFWNQSNRPLRLNCLVLHHFYWQWQACLHVLIQIAHQCVPCYHCSSTWLVSNAPLCLLHCLLAKKTLCTLCFDSLYNNTYALREFLCQHIEHMLRGLFVINMLQTLSVLSSYGCKPNNV